MYVCMCMCVFVNLRVCVSMLVVIDVPVCAYYESKIFGMDFGTVVVQCALSIGVVTEQEVAIIQKGQSVQVNK